MRSPLLRDYQKEASDQSIGIDRLAYLWSPRLGKSYMPLDLMARRGVKRAVISSPLVVCPQWVDLCRSLDLEVIQGFKGPTANVPRRLNHDGVLIVNDDRLRALQSEIVRFKPDLFVGDESHRFRGVSSARGRAMRYIARHTPLIRLLTGTPTPNHMGNLWGQMTAIREDLWDRSYERFARKFLIRDSLFPSRVLGVIREDELRAMLLECASILRREEVYGPDTWQIAVKEVVLPSMARRVYQELVKTWASQVSDDLEVEAFHVLKRMVRLQQLTSGFLPDDNEEPRLIHTAKLDLVVNDIEDIVYAGESAVVFHRFTWEGNLYARELSRRVSCPIAQINGSTSAEDRGLAVRVNNAPEPSVLVVQTQAGGIGISLRGATHALFVSQSFNFDDEEQARDRIYEEGRSKCVTYYRVRNSIDSYIGRVLESKESIHNAVRHADISSIAYDAIEVTRGGVV